MLFRSWLYTCMAASTDVLNGSPLVRDRLTSYTTKHLVMYEYSGLISFRTDRLDLLAVQGTLKSLFQHHSSKASILWCLVFFMIQLSDPYMTTGKAIALTIGTNGLCFFNMLSRFVIAFLPRSKHLLISCLQSPSAEIWEPKEIKSVTFHCFPIYLHEVMGPDAMILVF